MRFWIVVSIMFLFAKSSCLGLKGFPRATVRSSSTKLGATPEYLTSSYTSTTSNQQYMKYVSSARLNIAVSASTEMTYKGDLLVIPFYRPADAKDITDDKLYVAELKKSIPSALPADIQTIVAELLDECFFKAEAMTKSVMRVSHPSVRYIALVGLGANPKKGDPIDLEISSAARLGKLVAGIAKDIKGAGEVGVVMPTGTNNGGITQFLLGIHDNSYVDNRFKKVPDEGFKPHPLKSLVMLGCSPAVTNDAPVNSKLTDMIASGVYFARDLVGAPANSATPLAIAELARGIAKDHNLQCTILGQKECEERNMGGYLGVQQGSLFAPQFIHLTYKPENPTGEVVKIALVGKGLTFDSGGYNLKTGSGIEMMKFDMGGCAAVLGCAIAIGQLRPKHVEVHFITAVCENMISAEAMRPGDILVTSNGKTVEIMNTDAEGRLTLADALVYAEKTGASTIIDLATLTGAVITALGEQLAALYSNDDDLKRDIEFACKRTDEGIWHMPLESKYKDFIKAPLADLKNTGAKGGGSITAALFLSEFVDKAKWAHIDIAGTVWDSSGNKPTGYGVKMLTDYILNIKVPK